jgi:hypothetical protein
LSGAAGLLFILAAGSSFGDGVDPIWLFSDKHETISDGFQYCDTARKKDLNCYALKSDQLYDTGDVWDSKCINLDYQFSNDTFKVFDEFDPEVLLYKEYRPGFAGFKTAWDNGMSGCSYGRYKYLVFAHKGPNPNHKVTVKAWYNNGECGAPSYCETIGTFNASTEWKLDSIAIPESMTNVPDSIRNGSIYFELVVIITNIDDSKSPSEKCNFKMDDIRLVGLNPILQSPKSDTVDAGSPLTLSVTADPAKSSDVLSYQWKKNGAAISGATSKTYTISSVKNANKGSYTVDVKVSSTGYTYTSNAAEVIVTGSDPVEPKSGPCGSGALLAFLPPFFLKAWSIRRKKNK